MADKNKVTSDAIGGQKPVTHSEGKPPGEARSSAEKAAEAIEKKGLEPVEVKLPADTVMALSHPPESELSFIEREPDKVIPPDGSDGADTPSGAALKEVGAPNPLAAGTEEERQKGLQYRALKYVKRWMG